MYEKYTLYIGSNNATGKLELDKITSIAIRAFPEGFTLTKCRGYWKDTSEKSAQLTIATVEEERPRVYALAQELKTALEQQAILVEITNPSFNFI